MKSDIKFLANVNVEKPIIDFLVKKGFDIKWVTDIDKQMSDVQVCEVANKERRVVLTNDKDFGEIVFFQKRISYGIVLMRVKGQNANEKILLLEKLLDKYSGKVKGHFVVVTKPKFKFIPMEVPWK